MICNCLSLFRTTLLLGLLTYFVRVYSTTGRNGNFNHFLHEVSCHSCICRFFGAQYTSLNYMKTFCANYICDFFMILHEALQATGEASCKHTADGAVTRRMQHSCLFCQQGRHASTCHTSSWHIP
jgi:hypothetical protein